MTIRVAINGFGRIGRCVLRSAWQDPSIEIVHINDLTSDTTLAHLLKYDSVHGRFNESVDVVEGGLKIGESFVHTSATRDPAELPWTERNIDVVLECTGFFLTEEGAGKHLQAGAKRVIVSAPGKSDSIKTIVVGVNDNELRPEHKIVSNASCTTNCLAPLAKVLDEVFGIENGLMTTVHAYTGNQNILDAPHKDLRRGRAAAMSMIPTTTGAAAAVGKVLPQLNGKLNGMAIRVPTPNVSLVDLVFTSKKDLTAESINAALIEAAQGPLKGVLDCISDPVVSIDLVGNPNSSTVDLGTTQTMGPRMAKVLSWYDNEWGFSNRMIDLAKKVSALEN